MRVACFGVSFHNGFSMDEGKVTGKGDGYARSVSTRAWIDVLCLLVHRLLMCLLVQHESRCKHVSFWWKRQNFTWGGIMLFNFFLFAKFTHILTISKFEFE